ncbi:class I SAM-dependent methyltransferase [Streptomyces sp. NPDC050600]|uniref:class I SAM-dependent methyltransferase n=1 Tax=Streptomyces sp. NPDC050600 TaxID=3157213 RepID=UPI00341A8183
MSGQLYDEIGEAFEGFKTLPLARYGEVPGFLALVGDVRGKSVLDLASGTGFYSREFKRRGASRVLGVDISAEMIAAARSLEDADPLGIAYEVGDIAELRAFDEPFDLAVAVQAFNYADDVATIERMTRAIHRSLAPGAEFFVFTQNPEFRLGGETLAKYGFRCEPVGDENEVGPHIRLTALLDPPISFTAHPPRRDVFEDTLQAAGFTDVTWVPLEISPAGIKEYGEDFWQVFNDNPALTMLRCRA